MTVNTANTEHFWDAIKKLLRNRNINIHMEVYDVSGNNVNYVLDTWSNEFDTLSHFISMVKCK